MKLLSVHFVGPGVRIPGTDSYEWNFYASDGWEITRDEDGRVELARAGTRFVADGFSYTYASEEASTPERLTEGNVVPAEGKSEVRRRRRA